TKYLITTRIDNDDAFNIKAIEYIQDHFAHQDLLFLNFPIGYCLKDRTNQLSLNGSKSNPFISLIEKVTWKNQEPIVRTVRCMNHSHLSQIGTIKQIAVKTPMWLQVIHDLNIVNKLRGKPVPKGQLDKSQFGLV